MTTLLSLIAFAVLFALFGAVRPRRCGNCQGCTNACARDGQEHTHG